MKQLQYGWSSWCKSKLLITDKAIDIHVGNYVVPYHRFLKFAQDTRQAHRPIVTSKLSVPFLENWREICSFPYRWQLSLLHYGWEYPVQRLGYGGSNFFQDPWVYLVWSRWFGHLQSKEFLFYLFFSEYGLVKYTCDVLWLGIGDCTWWFICKNWAIEIC